MKLKLKHSIYMMIFFASFVPVCIWILYSMYDSERRMEKIISDNIQAIGGSQAMSIQNFCEGRKESMETISRMALVKKAILNYDSEGHSDALDEFLSENQAQKTYVASLSVVDIEFNIVGSSQKYEINGVSDFQYSDAVNHLGAFIMGDVYERETDEGLKRIIPAYIGVYDEDELIGYLIQEIDCDYFNRLRLQTEFLEDGTLYLLDGNNNIITAGTVNETESRNELVTSKEERESYSEAWNAFDHKNNSEGVIYYEYGGQKYMTYFTDIEYTNWGIRITENLTAQSKSNKSVYLPIILEAIAFVAILILMQMLITRQLVGPFNQIVSTLNAVRNKHDYSLRTGVKRNDEVGVVAEGVDELLEFAEKVEREEKQKHMAFAKKANEEAEELQHKEFLSSAMLANMPSGYHRCLPDAEKGFPFLQLGSHLEEILGWTAEEIKNDMGNCYKNLIWPEDLDVALTYTDMVSKVGSGNAYDTSVYRMKHKDGGYRWITDATMFVDLGEESFFQGVIADITTYVEGMEEAKQLAEASSHAKTDFLSQMSHDIRTPMNAVIGFTNLAKKSESLIDIKSEYIPKIETASNHLLMIINDVLEMNSIEKGKIIFRRSPQDIIFLADDIIRVLELQTKEKGVTLNADINIMNEYVYCDESRFNRVFMNLLSNAIKFTPKGGNITFAVEQTSNEKNGYGSYVFKVIDTGIGMSKEFSPKVFEPFERERTSTVSRVEGTGLGMAIVKSIIEAAGGTIAVESAPNKGTTFTIKLNLELVESSVVAQIEAGDNSTQKNKLSQNSIKEYFSNKRVLLVEDNEFNRSIAETVLESAGFIVESAEDGDIAVDMVKKAPSPDYYDIILMDIQMPTMNGYEATKAIRGMKDLRSRVKIIAVTANAFENDRKLAKESGMDGHISKPIDVDLLYSVLFDAIYENKL